MGFTKRDNLPLFCMRLRFSLLEGLVRMESSSRSGGRGCTPQPGGAAGLGPCLGVLGARPGAGKDWGEGGRGSFSSSPPLENKRGESEHAMGRHTTDSDGNNNQHHNNKKLAQPRIMAPRIQQQILPQRRQRVFLQSLKLI